MPVSRAKGETDTMLTATLFFAACAAVAVLTSRTLVECG